LIWNLTTRCLAVTARQIKPPQLAIGYTTYLHVTYLLLVVDGLVYKAGIF